MSRLIILIILFTFIVSSNIAAAEEVALTLDEAVAIGLRDNRDILLKAEDVKKAKQKIAEAVSAALPSVTLGGSWTNTREYYSKDYSQLTWQAGAKQYLFKGGRTINTIAYNKNLLVVSQALLDKTKLETAFNLENAFYTLLLATEFASLNKNILDNTKQHLEFTQARFKNGQASESDILKIKESLRTVEQVYQLSLNQVESSQLLLKNLLFLSKNIDIISDAQFAYLPEEVAYEEAYLKSMKSRPEIRQYEAQEAANKNYIEIQKADTRPSIYASWDYYSRSHAALGTQRGWNDYNVIGVTVSWPIFDGWAAKARVEQAIVDLKETQLTKEKTRRDIELELKNAYISLKDAIGKIQSTEASVAVYKDNLEGIKQKYQKGIASFLDLDDAQTSYNVASYNKKEAIYDYIIAKASFEKAQGGK